MHVAYVIPVVGIFVIHPHEVFFETVDLSLATDYPVVVHDHAVGAVFFRRKDSVSFLEVVHAAQVPVSTSTTLFRFANCHIASHILHKGCAKRGFNATHRDFVCSV